MKYNSHDFDEYYSRFMKKIAKGLSLVTPQIIIAPVTTTVCETVTNKFKYLFCCCWKKRIENAGGTFTFARKEMHLFDVI